MSTDLPQLLSRRAPAADHPLTGLTILVVEDSLFACEAMRLLCLRSGARIRRADCLRSAERHLATYRPTVVIIDIGLPDGSGIDLIRRLDRDPQRVPAIIATSGDATQRTAAMGAGADAFVEKPVDSLAAFQALILSLVARDGIAGPTSNAPIKPVGTSDRVTPDPLTLREDLARAQGMLSGGSAPARGYVAGFISGIAQIAHDADLAHAADRLAHAGTDPLPLAQLTGLVRERLAAGPAGF